MLGGAGCFFPTRTGLAQVQAPSSEQQGFRGTQPPRTGNRNWTVTGGGLVASHNDPCNGNWLVDSAGKVYLLDYESTSLDDPALDLGALLWWYYPSPLRAEFLEIAGYETDATLHHRMKVRMALHCLNIILPRKDSFDRFNAESFDNALKDFKAVLAGKENPQGYQD